MSLDSLLSPRSIAVVGAGREPGGVGRSVFDALLAAGFPGQVWPVNPRADEVAGHPCFPDIPALPGVPDLVLIAVPARAVPTVVEECGSAGVPSAIVLSAGFKEAGSAGVALERQVVAAASAHGMRLLGPNCLGLIIPGNHLNASFAGVMPREGSIAVITQSGALGTAVLDWARSRGGLSGFVSLGNRADLSESDFLEAFNADRATRVIAGYLESIVDGPRFVRVARECARTTPVVLLKAGSSEAGARAVSSHTGSLAGSDAAYDAAFAAAGVLRARDTEELFGMAEAFAHQPVPGGSGLVIITNAGGPAVMATDACAKAGVALAGLMPETVDALRSALPAAAALYNPVDLLGGTGPLRTDPPHRRTRPGSALGARSAHPAGPHAAQGDRPRDLGRGGGLEDHDTGLLHGRGRRGSRPPHADPRWRPGVPLSRAGRRGPRCDGTLPQPCGPPGHRGPRDRGRPRRGRSDPPRGARCTPLVRSGGARL